MSDVVKTDILIVGAGPAGLSSAIRAADELKKRGVKKRSFKKSAKWDYIY